MKKSKKVLLSAAIAAAIMGSVSVPQIYADDVAKVSIGGDLNVGGNVQANKIKVDDTIIADNANVVNSNISKLSVSGKAEFTGTDGVSISDSLTVGNGTFNVDAEVVLPLLKFYMVIS